MFEYFMRKNCEKQIKQKFMVEKVLKKKFYVQWKC